MNSTVASKSTMSYAHLGIVDVQNQGIMTSGKKEESQKALTEEQKQLAEERERWEAEKEKLTAHAKEMEWKLDIMTECYKAAAGRMDTLLLMMDKKDEEIQRLKVTMQLNNMLRRMQIKEKSDFLVEDHFDKLSDEGFSEGDSKSRLKKKVKAPKNCGEHPFEDYACGCE